MLRGFLYFVCAFFTYAIAPREAAAGIPIPCTGEHLVLVRQLPDNVKIQTPQGMVHINLGYKFNGCTDGKWVGYPGTGRTYYDLPEAVLELYVIRAGLKGLPREPSYLFTLSASWPAWLWAGMLCFGAVGTYGRTRASAVKAPSESDNGHRGSKDGGLVPDVAPPSRGERGLRGGPAFGRRT